MDSGLEEVTLAEVINALIEDKQIDLHVAIPAKVESYDASKQTVSVVPHLKKAMPDGAGNYITKELPKLADVPVQFQRCGQFALTFPIAAGDYGTLIICERNIGSWRATGNVSDPGDLGMHTLDGATFLPGLFPDSKPAQTADSTNMVLGSDTDGDSRIELKPSGGINLGAGATKGVCRDGDHGNVGTLTLTVTGTSVLSGTYTDPDGTPTVISSGTPIPLKNKQNEASSKIKAV